jgi:hypothetical protein
MKSCAESKGREELGEISGRGKGKVILWTGHEGPEAVYTYSSTFSLTSALDGVDSQRYAPAALLHGKGPGTYCTAVWVVGDGVRLLVLISHLNAQCTLTDLLKWSSHVMDRLGKYPTCCTDRILTLAENVQAAGGKVHPTARHEVPEVE